MSTSPSSNVTLPATERFQQEAEREEALTKAPAITPCEDEAALSDNYYALPCTD